MLASAVALYCGTAFAGTYSEVRTEHDGRPRRFEFDASVLPQVEAKLAGAERKLWEDPPANLADEGRHLSEVKRNLAVYTEQLPAYESVKKMLEEMLAKVKAGERIRGLHPRLSSIRRTKIDRVLTSPYMQSRKRKLHDLIGVISNVSREMEKAGRRARMSSVQKRIEEEKQKREQARKQRARELKKARTPKYLFSSEFDKETSRWEANGGKLEFSRLAPGTEGTGFAKVTPPAKAKVAGGMTIDLRRDVVFVPGMVVEMKIYRDSEWAAQTSFWLHALEGAEGFYFYTPAKEWFTKRLTVTGMCQSKEQKQPGTPYLSFRTWSAVYHEEEEGAVYIDYVRILPPPEPEEDEGPERARP